MLATLQSVLKKAYKEHYAVGAFNINDLEILEAVIGAAKKLKSPVIVSTSEGAIKYAGIKYLASIVKTASEDSKVPVVLHLDHGKDFEIIKQAINSGYSGIMFDGSHLRFEDNIRQTAKIAKLAHAKGIGVEGELGTIGGAEDNAKSKNILYTDVFSAQEFVDRTGVDALAVAIGTSHGAFKFSGKPKLDIRRLKELNTRLKIPLVLHGASSVSKQLLSDAKLAGIKLGNASGVPESQVKNAIKNGIAKVNTDTDLRIAFAAAVRKVSMHHPEIFDPRKLLGPAMEAMQKVVEHRIKVFGSEGKA